MPRKSILQSLDDVAGYTAPPALHTDDEVWAEVRAHGVHALAQQMSITDRQLLDVLIAAALAKADEHRPSWIRRHTLDLTIAAVLAFLVTLAADLQFPKPVIRQVVARHALAPFQPIRAEDLEVREAPRKTGSFEKAADVVGRFALAPVKNGAVLAAADLSAAALQEDMAGRTIVLMPVKLNHASMPWSPPVSVTLVVTAHDAGHAPVMVNDAVLLALAAGSEPPMAYVAVKNDQLSALAGALGSSDVYVSMGSGTSH